jgi:DNA-binding response OmpR family regulator
MNVSSRVEKSAAGDPLFPLGAAAAEEVEGIGRPGLRPPAMLEGHRILVVDDDPGLRLLLRTTLADDEITVKEASSAEAASELVRSWEPTLVILDIGLPGASGLALCSELKHNASFCAPAVILLTGADTGVEEARTAGADALLRKPFSPIELVGLLDRLPSGSPALANTAEPAEKEQLIVYARDLSRLLQAERRQRRLLQHAYQATVTALTDALEARDPHRHARPSRSALRPRTRRRRPPQPAHRSKSGIRLSPPRHRQDRDS